jgi:hypothetical protein
MAICSGKIYFNDICGHKHIMLTLLLAAIIRYKKTRSTAIER